MRNALRVKTARGTSIVRIGVLNNWIHGLSMEERKWKRHLGQSGRKTSEMSDTIDAVFKLRCFVDE